MNQPNFLNVDLEIVSDSPELLKMAEELETTAVVLHAGPGPGDDDYLMTLESNDESPNPDEVIHDLCDLIEKFSNQQRAIWDNAKSRLFDVGYDQDAEKHGTRFRIDVKSLRRIVALNADLGVSVYRIEEDE